MSSFKDAAQVKTELKMNLSNFAWYKSIAVGQDDSGYCVVVQVSKIDNSVRKVVPQVVNGIAVKVESET